MQVVLYKSFNVRSPLAAPVQLQKTVNLRQTEIQHILLFPIPRLTLAKLIFKFHEEQISGHKNIEKIYNKPVLVKMYEVRQCETIKLHHNYVGIGSAFRQKFVDFITFKYSSCLHKRFSES